MSTAHTATDGAPEMARTRVAKDQLKAYVERIERLEDEKKTIADDIRDVYAESKGNGFDVKALRAIIRLRKQVPHERAEHELILETYMLALGMIPAGDDEPPKGSGSKGGNGSPPRASNGSGHGSSSASEKLARPKAEQAASKPRGGDGVAPTCLVQAPPAPFAGEAPGPRETIPTDEVGAHQAPAHFNEIAGERDRAGPGASTRSPEQGPASPQTNIELSHVAVESEAGGLELGTPRPLPVAQQGSALPLVLWHAPAVFEVDPATDMPTFTLRGHPDCTVGRSPEVRPP